MRRWPPITSQPSSPRPCGSRRRKPPWRARSERSRRCLINQAKFRFKDADGNSIIYENRSLDRKQVLELLTCQFMDTFTNVILVGFTGSGKTYLACAIGKAAAQPASASP